jgi:putative heme-binding domain-containing protein
MMHVRRTFPLILFASLSIVGFPLTQRSIADGVLVAPTPPRTPDEERKGFHLPAGFEIELVACEPEIHKPLNLNFDDRGRLWVTSTVEYPFPVKEGETPRDAVKVLDKFQPNGRAARITTFADRLNIPIGVLPYGGGGEALVHSIPNVYHLVDTDGDGRADRREIFFSKYGFNDTHGLTSAFTWGFDGWIYACHGYANTSNVKGSDGEEITMQSGNTYRMKPDGSHLEYYTHGQVNPFGMSLDPWGNLYTADCHSRPVYQLIREGFYPSFGKPDDGLGFAPEMVSHDHGSTAISGVVSYAADQFPEEWRGTVFIGNVVTARVNHDKVEWHGSSPKGLLQPDFITSDDPWFRPVDLKLGPDGALYIADFYNRIIGHYEVPLTHPGRDRERGRIWRVVYRGDKPHRDAVAPRTDWTTAGVGDLLNDLDHPNLTVRMKATNQLVARRGDAVTQAVRKVAGEGQSAFARAHALWVLQRRGALDFELLRSGASDSDALVRVHTMRVLGERPEMPGPDRLLALKALDDPEPRVRRAAAEALGRHPAPQDVRPLIALARAVPPEDTHLLQVVRIALRDHLRGADSFATLPASRTDAEDRALADVSPGVPSAQSAAFLLSFLEQHGLNETMGTLARWARHIARWGEGSAVASLTALIRRERPDDLGAQGAFLKGIVQGSQERGAALDPALRDWAQAVAPKLLESKHPNDVGAGIEIAGAVRLPELVAPLTTLVTSERLPDPQRAAAIDALSRTEPAGAIGLLGGLLSDAGEPTPLRQRAADALGKIKQPSAIDALLKALPAAPATVQTAIAAGLASAGQQSAEALLKAIEDGRASARLLRQRQVAVHLASLRALTERVDRLTAGLPAEDQTLEQLLRKRREGFARARAEADLGASVFEKTCAACHQIAGKGARIAPQLDGVGARGPDRLIEDVLDPNRNVDLALRATTVALKSGQIVTGLLVREEGQVLVIADSQGKEVRVPAGDIEERKVTAASPMPANFSDQISEQDFYHLIAYLLSQRTAPAPSADSGSKR